MAIIEARNNTIFGIMYVEEEGSVPRFLWYESNQDRNMVFAALKMAGEVEIRVIDQPEPILVQPLWFCRIDKDTDIYYNEARSVFK